MVKELTRCLTACTSASVVVRGVSEARSESWPSEWATCNEKQCNPEVEISLQRSKAIAMSSSRNSSNSRVRSFSQRMAATIGTNLQTE